MASNARRKHSTEQTGKQRRKKASQSSQGRSVEPTAEERNTLYPPEFRDGQWPVESIYDETKDLYLIKWNPDPITGATYPKQWIGKRDVGQGLIDEWERAKSKRSILAKVGVGGYQTTHREQSSSEADSPSHKRRRKGLKRVISSSPKQDSLSPVLAITNHGSQGCESSGVEIQETQELPFIQGRVEVHVSALATLLDREEYVCLKYSGTSSQNTSTNPYYPTSSKEADNDSAVSLASPISKASPPSEDNVRFIQSSSNHNIQFIHSDLVGNVTNHLNVRPSQGDTECNDAVPGTPESALFCPEFRPPRDQSPDTSSESGHSCNHILSQPQPSRELSQAERDPCQDLARQRSVSSPFLVCNANPDQYLSPISTKMDTSRPSTQPPPQPPSSAKPSPMSLREKIALARTPSRASIDPSATPKMALMSLSPNERTPTPLSATQPIITTQTAPTASSNMVQPTDSPSDNVVPTIELPNLSHGDRVLSSTHKPNDSLPRGQFSAKLSPWKTRLDPFQAPSTRSRVYAVTLPATGHMRHRYREWFREKDLRLLSKFLQKPDSSYKDESDRSSVSTKVEDFFEQLRMATVHPDFNADPRVYGSMTQTVLEPSQEARWADLASTKFAFIGKLVEEIRMERRQIVVVAKMGQSTDSLQTYMRGKEYPFRRMNQSRDFTTSYGVHGVCDFVIIDSEEYSRGIALETNLKPDMFIDFDCSTELGKGFLGNSEKSTPIVHLIVVNSPEHIEKFLSPDLPPRDRLRCLALATTHLRRQMGLLPHKDGSMTKECTQTTSQVVEDIPESQELESQAAAAKLVAQALRSDNFCENWALPPLPLLDFNGIEATATLLDVREEPHPISTVGSRKGTPSGLKRIREQDSVPVTSKRLRTTPLQDVTHISDSLKDPQSQLEDLRSTLRTCESALASERNENSRLQKCIGEKEAHLEDVTVSLSRLQHRFETRTNEFHRLCREKANLESDKLTINAKRERISTENLSLRDDSRQLQEALHAARTALKEGGGSTADLENMREIVNKLEKERDSLLKSNENVKKDFEFTRQQYQLASNKAADLASQLLEKEASDEKRRLRELNAHESEKQHRATAIRSEEQVALMEKLLMKKEEELERARRGRGVQTRAGSAQPQPGSPRLAGRGADSRGASPVPALLGEARYAHGGVGIGMGGGRTSALRREG